MTDRLHAAIWRAATGASAHAGIEFSNGNFHYSGARKFSMVNFSMLGFNWHLICTEKILGRIIHGRLQ